MIIGYEFLDARLNLDQREIQVGGTTAPLRPKPFAVMKLLASSQGRIVSKQELLDSVWADAFVQDGSLARAISDLRQILGTGRGDERYIATVSRVGYRLVPQVTPLYARKSLQRSSTLKRVFVGRQKELDVCRRFFERVGDGESGILCLTGGPGIGKSSLLRTLLDIYDDPASCATASTRCPEPIRTDAGYLPAIELLEDLCRTDQEVPGVRSALKTAAPSWNREVFGEAELRLDRIGGERTKREFSAFLERLSTQRPVVLLIDDFHWSDHSTVDLLLYLTSRFEVFRVGIVLLYRSTDLILRHHPWLSAQGDLITKGLAEELSLSLLGEAEVGDYLDQAYPGHQFPEGLATFLYRHTEGHPLFLTALVEHLKEDGVIEEIEAQWVLSSDSLEDLPGLPVSIKRMISRQLAQLDATQKEILTIAAIRGFHFEGEIIADVSGQPRAAIERCLRELESTYQLVQTIESPRGRKGAANSWYRFSHAVHQQAFSTRMQGQARQELCHALAQRLAQEYADDDSLDDRVAFLFEQAGDFIQSARYRLSLAKRASRCGATADAVENIAHGLTILDSVSQTRGVTELQILLNVALLASQRKGKADTADIIRTVSRVRELSRQIDESETGLWHMLSFLRNPMRVHSRQGLPG